MPNTRGRIWQVIERLNGKRHSLPRMRSTANISESAKASGIDRQSVYKRQREHPEFVAAMKDAKDDAIDSIAKAALETASAGRTEYAEEDTCSRQRRKT